MCIAGELCIITCFMPDYYAVMGNALVPYCTRCICQDGVKEGKEEI